MKELDQQTARYIIDIACGQGIPPEYGFQYFSAGLEDYLSVIDEEYLSSFIQHGGAAFKMVLGVYGGGKTHFLYNIRELAWRHNFVVSYVTLSPTESPFHRLDLVYNSIVRGIISPSTPEELISGVEQGMQSFLKSYYSQKSQDYDDDLNKDDLLDELRALTTNLDNSNFAKGVKEAFKYLVNNQEEDFENVCQWLSAEGYDRRIHGRYGILQKIDKITAFAMLRSLGQFIRQLGFSGLVILFDEAEQVPSLSSKQREQLLMNLRQLIDECGHTNCKGVMIFYSVPDENFLEGKTQVYEALKQRVSTVFDDLNPVGVKINLEDAIKDPIKFLCEVGNKIINVYEIAYNCKLDSKKSKEAVKLSADVAFKQKFGDTGYKRLFMQKVVRALHFLSKKGIIPSEEELG